MNFSDFTDFVDLDVFCVFPILSPIHMSVEMEPQCQALNLSDHSRCTEIANSYEQRFCWYHAKQCYGLYMGYKRRNARLDQLTSSPPNCLAATKTTLAKETFAQIGDENELNEVYSYLHEQLSLLHNVIEARRLHHSRFFSVDVDYGHQVYVDKLSNRKFLVERALERLTRRIAEVLYDKHQWFEWARDCQEEEESNRQSEKVKIQRESALFKRHAKEVEASLARKRHREDGRKQELFLDEAYKARLAEEDVDTWDPIQDSMDDLRESYVDLIKHFLWWPAQETTKDPEDVSSTVIGSTEAQNLTADAETFDSQAAGGGKKKKKRRPQSKTQSKTPTNIKAQQPLQQPDKGNIETLDELRERLGKSAQISELPSGAYIAGTVETPVELWNQTAPVSADEMESLIDEMKKVKLFLFCRLLLSHAVLLPVAIEVSTVEEFLSHPKVLDKDLRELCLKMEQPPLQAVRDACADLGRSEYEADVEEDPAEAPVAPREFKSLTELLARDDVRMFDGRKRRDMPHHWQSKREQERKKRFQKVFSGEEQTFIDFGITKNDGSFQRRKVRVKLCGHWIWNYASDVDMTRSSWLLFSMMTNCSLFKATELCRSWTEFFELSVLAVFNYFPTSFRTWAGDRFKQQLLMMGFMPYMLESQAEHLTIRRQTGARSHTGRQHMLFEARPFICGQMRRNDPVTRRFIQYLSMMSSKVLVLARDGKSGKILLEPHEEQRWLKRVKSGIGRAAKNQWQVLQSVGEKFFKEMDTKRAWSLSFNDYYDVYVWALAAGENFHVLCNVVHDTLWKARRITEPKQMYDHMEPVLRTITRDKVTQRARDIKPNEQVKSIFHDIIDGEVRVGAINPHQMEGIFLDNDPRVLRKILYNEADALEDAVLFPDELLSGEASGKFEEISSSLLKFERGGPSLARWVVGAEFDEATSDYFEDTYDNNGSDDEESLSTGRLEGDQDKDGDAWATSNSEYEFVLASEERSGSRSRGFGPTKNTASGVETGVDAKWAINDSRDLLEFKDPGKASTSLEKLRGTKHGWETAFAAIMLADQNGEPDGIPLVVDWLANMLEVEDHALEIPDDPMLADAKFMEWMEKERSGAFKEIFHKLDPVPFNQQWKDSMELIKTIEAWEIGDVKRGSFVISQLIELGVTGDRSTRRAYRDMARSFAQMSLSFPSLEMFSMETFLEENEVGCRFKESLLLKPDERAKMIPQCRSRESNQTRPDDFFDEYCERVLDVPGDKCAKFPLEWDAAIRPIVAKLYKEGVIAPAHQPAEQVEAQAIAAKEPGSEQLDFFIFYNKKFHEQTFNKIEHPSRWPDVKAECRSFAAQEPNARFALLRVFSTPYFYPLMIGYGNRQEMAFVDGIGRTWHWKFIPKDYPGSERSIHHTTQLALQKYGRQLKLGKQVRVRRDVVLVLGKDEEDLAKLAMGVCYAIQSRPWIREIDLWKSFVNVDLKFIEGLDKWWIS